MPPLSRFIGIGIKLALYDVDAPADAFFAHDQKLLLGASCAACFMLTEMMAPMHTATVKEYFSHLLSNKVSVVCFVAWMCIASTHSNPDLTPTPTPT